jgi:hypothetical protein
MIAVLIDFTMLSITQFALPIAALSARLTAAILTAI